MAPTPPSEDEIGALIQQVLGVQPTELSALRSGAWSSALKVSTPESGYVLRFAKTDDDFRSDAHASRFASPNLPIPRVYDIGQLGQRWWCLSDFMPGLHLDELSPEDFGATVPSIADMLIAMREVDSSGTTGYGGWGKSGYGLFDSFADQLLDVAVDHTDQRGGGWSAFLAEHIYEQNIFRQGLALMTDLCHYLPDSRQLIHMDTINYNVNVVDNRISGIYDWGCAMWGDAIYDLAWFRFWDDWYPERLHLRVPETLEHLVGLQGSNIAERMRCCQIHIGIGHIRYNAFIGDARGMNDVARATEKLLQVNL